jgi:hypothetical protein
VEASHHVIPGVYQLIDDDDRFLEGVQPGPNEPRHLLPAAKDASFRADRPRPILDNVLVGGSEEPVDVAAVEGLEGARHRSYVPVVGPRHGRRG